MKHAFVFLLAMTMASAAYASTASQREYKRGYADCAAGRWDEYQHGASYKRGCRAAENKRGDASDPSAPAETGVGAMMESCRARAASAYSAAADGVDVKYEGQRVDGTHAVNGTVSESGATFQCSFNRNGSKIVRFVRNKAPTSSSRGAASSGVSSKNVRVCLRAVASQTGNRQVALLSSESSEANDAVIVGVGPHRAPWRCLVKDGVVAGVMSLTDEGKL